MEPPPRPTSSSTSLFQVFLRLRPHGSNSTSTTAPSIYPTLPSPERFLTVELPEDGANSVNPTHITIRPPSDSRKRAVEKFAFTRVFEEATSQLEIFNDTGAVSLVEGILNDGRDGLVATLGVTGSGKTHTILGSKSQRGVTQLSLDLVFRSLEGKTLHPTHNSFLLSSLMVADASEAQIQSAAGFLDGIYGDNISSSRAATPMTVGNQSSSSAKRSSREGICNQWDILGFGMRSLSPQEHKSKEPDKGSVEMTSREKQVVTPGKKTKDSSQDQAPLPSRLAFWNSPRMTRTKAKLRFGTILQDASFTPSTRRHVPQRPSALPRLPDISSTIVSSSRSAEYAVLVSMYEVYNDRIFDLLSHPKNAQDRRRPLLFKSTEGSPDRKLVAGLKKIVCGTYEEAMLVLETGLTSRRVAGTGSNSVSSRSHGFFCVEVKKRPRSGMASAWTGSTLTVVDLAGSERARNAKTAGATLAEAGKINESLMYLGQCLQMQSDFAENSRTIVPFRQCKLTELLFSNSFPQASTVHSSQPRNAQRAVMIITADPLGDFNATSQILRYSALAREVTVPRIPSVASIVFKDGGIPNSTKSGRNSPDQATIEELEGEVSKLNDQVEILALRLAEETARRREAEEAWQTATERLESLEVEVRVECFEEMESKLETERRRWMEAFGDQADQNDAHMDAKLEILTRGIKVHEDSTATSGNSTRERELEDENSELRSQLARLEREMQMRSPTKPRTSRANATPRAKMAAPPKLGSLETAIVDDPFAGGKENQDVDAIMKIEDLAIAGLQQEGNQKPTRSPTKSPKKKMRTLTPARGVAPGVIDEDLNGLMGTP